MIGHLSGTVIATGAESVIVSAGGVGYRVFATPDTISHMDEGSAAAVWTHLAVRENALDLYGFATKEELRFFELLLGVSGIGPKSALGVMSVAALETLRSAIGSGDATHLTKVGGIGKKTAEKIVLELREKIGPVALGSEADRADIDAMEALLAMGYSANDAREALKRVSRDITGSNERLREALRGLGS